MEDMHYVTVPTETVKLGFKQMIISFNYRQLYLSDKYYSIKNRQPGIGVPDIYMYLISMLRKYTKQSLKAYA